MMSALKVKRELNRAGDIRSENVGMSNVMKMKTLHTEIPKVSYATSVDVGLVGPKARPKGVVDG